MEWAKDYRTGAIEREAELDGLYVIRTSEPRAVLSAEDTVRNYKNLTIADIKFNHEI